MPKITDKVYLEISINDEPSGKIVFGLFGEVVPRTTENFKRLCACDAGKGKLSGVDLCYKNTSIHRIGKFKFHLSFLPTLLARVSFFTGYCNAHCTLHVAYYSSCSPFFIPPTKFQTF